MAVEFVVPRFTLVIASLPRGRDLLTNQRELWGSRVREAPLGAACRLGS